MKSVGIVGVGIVGNHLKSLFLQSSCYDIHIELYKRNKDLINNSEFAFIAVNTPSLKNGQCDISQVEDVLSWLDSDYICIKSTIPPGTTDALSKKYHKKICFSPEYQGETIHTLSNPDFVILGGDKEVTTKFAQLFQYTNNASLKIFQTDTKTAELCKYMENSYLAMKVIFANEFYRIAKILGVNYNELRELWLLDSRINRSHTFVFEDEPYYDSKCFNKDLPALLTHLCTKGYNAEFIQSIIDINNQFKKRKNEL